MCPDGHGTLVTGKYLSDIEISPYLDETKNTRSVDSKHQVVCPYCSVKMHKVDYNSTDIIIDACTKLLTSTNIADLTNDGVVTSRGRARRYSETR